MKPEIVNKDAFVVVGLKYTGDNKNNEIPQLWGQLMPVHQNIKDVSDWKVAFGVCDNFIEEKGIFDYIAGYQVSSTDDVPDGMVSWNIPAGQYAVFTTTVPDIHKTMDKIYKEWLPTSGYLRSAAPEFELYDEKFDPNDPTSIFYLYIPIKKKE